MRSVSRARYHYALRFVKKENDKIVANRIANNLLNNNNRRFWNDVRKTKQNPVTIPTFIDNVIDPKAISNLFAEKYKTLYNSVSYSKCNMDQLTEKVNSDIKINVVKVNVISPILYLRMMYWKELKS